MKNNVTTVHRHITKAQNIFFRFFSIDDKTGEMYCENNFFADEARQHHEPTKPF